MRANTRKLIRGLYRRLGFHRAARLRRALNRLTRGRIGTYSTVEHYTDGPAAKIISSEQFSTATSIRCPVCGWKGTAGDGEIAFYTDLFDVSCPRCMKMLLVVGA